jgi:hypothetical protein
MSLAAPPEQAPPARPLRPILPWAFLLIALVYLYAFPYFDALRSAAEIPRILTTQELVDHGHMWLDKRLGDMGSRNDLSSAPDGHKYANKPPGPSFLAVPAYLLCKLVRATSLRACSWAFRFSAAILPALIFLPFFYRFTRRFSPDETARRTVLLAYAVGSPALIYGILFMSHQLSAVLAGASFIAAVAVARNETWHPGRGAALAGFLASLALLMDYQSLIATSFIALYLGLRAARKIRALLFAAAGALAPLFVLMLYHARAFGSPWKTGYSFADDPNPRNSFGGMVGLSAKSFWNVSFLPSNGLFVLAPWTLLAVVGFVAVWTNHDARKRVGAEALVCLAIFAAYVVFLSSLGPYMSRGGWCVGPRYMTTALPFVAWLAAAGFAAFDRTAVTRVLAQAAVWVSAAIFVVAASTYPHWPDPLANPLYELSFRLLRDGYAVHSLGTLVGLRGFLATAPLFLLVGALLLWMLTGRGWRRFATSLAACALAIAILASYRSFPRSGAYAERAYGFVTSTWEPRRVGR